MNIPYTDDIVIKCIQSERFKFKLKLNSKYFIVIECTIYIYMMHNETMRVDEAENPLIGPPNEC